MCLAYVYFLRTAKCGLILYTIDLPWPVGEGREREERERGERERKEGGRKEGRAGGRKGGRERKKLVAIIMHHCRSS